MCRVKPYTEIIQQDAKGIVVRLDYYSTTQSRDRLVNAFIGERYVPFEERKLNDLEMQTVNLDACAEATLRSLNGLMSEPGVIIDETLTDETAYQIIIHRNFMAIVCDFSLMDTMTFVRLISAHLDTCRKVGGISMVALSCIVQHSRIEMEEDEVWRVFDRSAFPVMDEIQWNGRYVDSSDAMDLHLDLDRSIHMAEDGRYDIVVTASAVVYIENTDILKTPDGQDGCPIVDRLTKETLSWTTKCYL